MLNSIFLGTSGNYEINGIKVNFVENANGEPGFENSLFGRAVDVCLNNSAIRFLTFGYLHVFIHEMGHAFAAQLHGLDPIVNIYTQSCRGYATHGGINKFTALAGPLSGITLELIKLVGAVAMATLLPPFLGLPLGIFIGAGAAFWTFGELMYALVGAGDWDVIRE